MSSSSRRASHTISLFLTLLTLSCIVTVTANYPLPPFWTQLYAPDGTPYYFNQQTGVSQYHVPGPTDSGVSTYDSSSMVPSTSEADTTTEYNTYASQSTAAAWNSETGAWGSEESSQQYMQQYSATQQPQEGFHFDSGVDPADISDDEGWYDDRFRTTSSTAIQGSSIYHQQGKQKSKSFLAAMSSFKSSISSIKEKLTPR